jgi:hypothetical protein
VRAVGATALKGGEYQRSWFVRQCSVTSSGVAVLAHGLLGALVDIYLQQLNKLYITTTAGVTH